MSSNHSMVGKVAFALGKGIIAGLAGTAAITLAQIIEMKLTGRQPSDSPAEAASKVLDVEATDQAHQEQFVQEVHWTYGTLWGLGRSTIDIIGFKGIAATALHFAAVWGTAMVMLPSLNIAPPVKNWGVGTIAKDGLEHLIYGIAAGLVYDAID